MTTCPVCRHRGEFPSRCTTTLTGGTVFDLAECPSCGTRFFDPLPTNDQLSAFYSAAYYDFDRWREEGKGMAFASRLRRWKSAGRFIDVGCATGFFINGIRKHSQWEVYGTDVGTAAVAYARETLGLNVFHGELSDAAFPAAHFDYVHVNNVLEHVLDPVALLRECRRIIKPDGLFFLSVPNGLNDSLDLIDFWREESLPARSKSGHIFFFPPRTMRTLLTDSGFTPCAVRTYSLKRGLRSAGILPRKKDWKTDYRPRTEPEALPQERVLVPDTPRKHSDLYYRFRFIQGNLSMLPGLHHFGLDFLFLSKPLV